MKFITENSGLWRFEKYFTLVKSFQANSQNFQSVFKIGFNV